MAGGTWVDQNKIRPGVYINYKSAPGSLASMGERGTVAIARVLDWGDRGKFYTLSDPSDCEQFGHAITDAECLFIRQILLGTNRTQGASKILLWSLETAEGVTYARNVSGSLTVQAKEPGPDGNKLSYTIAGGDAKFTLYNDGVEVGKFTPSGTSISSLITAYNSASEDVKALITLSGDGSIPAVTQPVSLTGGVYGSEKATATIGNLVATAKYYGSLGNRLSVVVTAGESANYIVQTLLDGEAVDSQVVSAISGLVANDYVVWSGSGSISTSTGVALTGGTNGEARMQDYSSFLDALEVESFNIVIYDGDNATIQSAFTGFVKRLSNNEGIKCQAVVSNMSPNPDNECVINVYPHSVTLSDGSVLNPGELTWWVGGAQSGANVNESLTYCRYPDAVDFSPKLNSAAQEAAITGGQLSLISNKGNVQILTDINSFRTYAVEKGKAFSKNRVVRTVFGLCNDIYDAFSTSYIGAVSNDEEGRKALKGEILNLMNRYQGIRALQNVETEDVTVLKGVDSDAVVIEIYCQPVDSIEKIYVNITIS